MQVCEKSRGYRLKLMYLHELYYVSHPNSRSDPNDGSEPSSGRETKYWDSLPALSDIGVSKSYNCINISYTKIQNKTTIVVVFTLSHIYSPESHLHIQKLYICIYIIRARNLQ